MSGAGIVSALLLLAQGYLLLGLAFALAFVTVLAPRVDPATRGSSLGFRIIIVPSVALLWPLLLGRLLRGRKPPAECNAHRPCRAAQRNDEP